MDAGYISGMAALAGSAIGALASAFADAATQRAQDRARCEALYGEFIREASRLFGDASELAQSVALEADRLALRCLADRGGLKVEAKGPMTL
jgi:hypothetical protein